MRYPQETKDSGYALGKLAQVRSSKRANFKIEKGFLIADHEGDFFRKCLTDVRRARVRKELVPDI